VKYLTRLSVVLCVLAVLGAAPATAFAAGSGNSGPSAVELAKCLARLKKDGIKDQGTRYEICNGAFKPTKAVNLTLNSIDSSAFHLAKRMRKYIYGGRKPGFMTLWGACMVFVMIWYGFQMLILGADDLRGTSALIATLMRGLFFMSLMLWAMYNYVWILRQFDAGINWLSSVFLSNFTPSSSSGLAAYVRDGTEAFVGMTVQFIGLRPHFPASGLSALNVGKDLSVLAAWLISMVLWIIPLFLVFIEMILFVGLGILAQILFAVGVAFGPLMIVLSILPFLRRLVTSWIHFLISAGFYKLVLACIVALSASVFMTSIKLLSDVQTAFNINSNHPFLELFGADAVYKILVLSGVVLLLFGLILAMLSASRMANHLITGFGTFDIGLKGVGGGPKVGIPGGKAPDKDEDGASKDKGNDTDETKTTPTEKTGDGNGDGQKEKAGGGQDNPGGAPADEPKVGEDGTPPTEAEGNESTTDATEGEGEESINPSEAAPGEAGTPDEPDGADAPAPDDGPHATMADEGEPPPADYEPAEPEGAGEAAPDEDVPPRRDDEVPPDTGNEDK